MAKQTSTQFELRTGRSTIIRISAFALVVGMFTALGFFLLQPTPTAAQAGAGRLLVTGFADTLIYAINADPAAGPQNYTVVGSYPGNGVTFPSVATQTGTIAYLYRTGNVGFSRVWAMNGDGSNVRQLTSTADISIQDKQPVTSPDGTKVALISNRFNNPLFANNEAKSPEVFIVNADGTNLHQVTPSEQASAGANHNTSIDSVGWNANGSALFVVGGRVVSGVTTIQYGLFKYNADGSGQTTVKITGGTGFATVEGFDVSRDGSKVAYSNGDRIFIFDSTSGNLLFQLNSIVTGAPNSQGAGSVRFSPDGTRVLFGSSEENGCARTINLDGSNRVTVSNNLGAGGLPKWWISGSPVPVPARFALTPSVLKVPNDGTTRQVTPTLYDTSNHVIFHAATYELICDGAHPCSGGINPGNTFEFFPDGQIHVRTPGDPATGFVWFCGNSGGLSGCSLVNINSNVSFAEIRAVVPSTNTNGTSGPGIFTIRRESTQSNTALTIDFTVGGTAVRGLDYALNVNGNSIILAAGQTTADIQVTPSRAAGNKTVTLNIHAGPGANYATNGDSESANVNIVDNGVPSSTITLASVTPTTGGAAPGVGVSVFGSNIRPGATLKLERQGQTPINSTNVTITNNGSNANASFDLTGVALGTWDVVVTNSDNTSARLNNSFTVDSSAKPQLEISMSGPDSARASHNRSHYDVVYTNRGNVDAFGVFLFITGISPNQCVQADDDNCTFFETPLQSAPDIPGQPPTPSSVHNLRTIVPITIPEFGGPGIRLAGATSVFLPRIPAHSSGVFRFTMRFSVISQSGFMQIRASLTPPLLKAVSNGGALTLVPDNVAFAGMSPVVRIALRRAFGFDVGTQGLNSVMSGLQVITQFTGITAIQNNITIYYNGYQIIGETIVEITCTGCDDLDDTDDTDNDEVIIDDYCHGFGDIYGDDPDDSSDLDGDGSLFYWSEADLVWLVRMLQSIDPNEKTGITGKTSQNFVNGNAALQYTISFENQPTASASAQDVVITDQLDPSKVDLSTFTLGPVSFGSTFVNVPVGLKTYITEVDLRPANNLLVRVTGQLNQTTGLVTWEFHSIDPFTRQAPTDARAGFLPPDIQGDEGRGKVLFSISPHGTLPAGTEIRNRAQITFDLNAPLPTNEWLNTIDNSKPTSSVQTLQPQQQSVVFNVDWAGTDTGSGIKDYTLYVSENGGAFQPAEVNTTATTKPFIGKPNTTYSFYTIARDAAENVETSKTTAETTTHTPAAPLNTIDDARFYVRQHYLDFLNREPDPSGWNFWTNQITGCGNDTQCVEVKRINVSAAFFLSIEFQETGYFTYLIYKESYGNLPGAPVPVRLNELLYDKHQISRGVVVGQTGWEQVLENNKQAYLLAFVQRSRFTSAFPTSMNPVGFVDKLFLNAGVTPSATDRTDAINEFGPAVTTADIAARARVLRRVANNSAFKQQEFNKAFVLMQYDGYLRRNPNDAPEPSLDYQGFNFWLNKLNQFGGNFVNAEMVKAFIISGEYRQRFKP